ncbi:MAG: hypothetical protein ABJN34_00025 [Litoreibacter sp.]|uniref:hypothetical protein n=1 Tax=Litoreibacter sp. TaxID=1969459 RepID=UPI0032971EC1
MVFDKLTNGLADNFSELIYPFHLDANGYPSVVIGFGSTLSIPTQCQRCLLQLDTCTVTDGLRAKLNFLQMVWTHMMKFSAKGGKSERGSGEEADVHRSRQEWRNSSAKRAIRKIAANFGYLTT